MSTLESIPSEQTRLAANAGDRYRLGMTRRSVPPVVLVPLLIVAIVISSSACGTIANFSGNVRIGPTKNMSDPPPLPFGGVIWNVQNAVEADSTWRVKAVIFPFWLVELGISSGLDTITLPIVAWVNAKRAYLRAVGNEPEKEATNLPVPINEDKFRIEIVSPTAMEKTLNPNK